MNLSYRAVLHTNMGEFYSEPTATYREVREMWNLLGPAASLLTRVEINDGSGGWVTL